MPAQSPTGNTLRYLLSTPEGEADPTFQAVIEQQTRHGLVVTAALGIVGALLFIGIHLATGSTPVWIYREGTAAAVSLADKTFIVGLCIGLLAVARTSLVRRWGRGLLATVMVVSGLAIALDDLAGGDFSFTVAWLVLVQLVAVVTVPFTPRQALGIAASMIVVYTVTLSFRPEGLSTDLYEHRFAYFLFATVIVVTLASYLYTARYGQHRALLQVEQLRDKLAVRTDELERSLRDLSTAQTELVRHEKLAALGQVTSGVAHEIQNPLNFVTNFAALNRDLVADLQATLSTLRNRPVEEALTLVGETLEDLSRNAASIDSHGQKAARIVSRMMEHARGAPGDLAPADVNEIVEEHLLRACHRLQERLGAAALDGPHAVRIERDYGEDVGHVRMDRREMGAVLLNLFDNAFRAALDRPAGSEANGHPPRVTVSTRRMGDAVEVRVADNGTGISDGVRERLFEPFFTTRSPGEGTGLGLSLAYDAVTHGHGGTLTVESEEGRGAAFVIRLPG